MASLPIHNPIPNFLRGTSDDRGPAPEETKNNTNNASTSETADNDVTQDTSNNSNIRTERRMGQESPPSSSNVDLEQQSPQRLGHEDYDNIRVYNLQPNVYPPYVLDSVARYKDLEEVDLSAPDGSAVGYGYGHGHGYGNTGGGGPGHSSTGARQSVNPTTNSTNDLFLSSINNNWNRFMTTIESKSSHLMQNKIVPLSPQHQHQQSRNQQQTPRSPQSPQSPRSPQSPQSPQSLRSPQSPQEQQQQQQHLSPPISNRFSKSTQDTQYENKSVKSADTSNNYDETTLEEYKLPDLSGSWEGDERLRKILNEDSYNTSGGSDGFSNTRFLRFFQKPNDPTFDNLRGGDPRRGRLDNQKKFLETNDYSPKIRSSAKYWMSTEQRVRWKPTLKGILLFNPYLLVTLRSFMFILCAIALGLAISIFRNSSYSGNDSVSQQPSTIMAVVVQSIALVYLIYITWDEYSGKPLGLRNPVGKIKLILLDLLFIIFSSANLSLAYNTLYDDRWVCVNNNLSGGSSNRASSVDRNSNVKISSVCDKQRGLSAFLFITLCMWVFTFTISIFRVVERVSSPKSS